MGIKYIFSFIKLLIWFFVKVHLCYYYQLKPIRSLNLFLLQLIEANFSSFFPLIVSHHKIFIRIDHVNVIYWIEEEVLKRLQEGEL